MKKVLLTGVAGFIGHRTCELLLEQGYEVVGVDNLNDYYDIKLKEFRLNSLKVRDNFSFTKIDISNLSDLNWLFADHKFDYVLNLAARAGVRYSMENPEVYVSTNSLGNLNLLNMCKKHKVKKYLLASTSSLYAGQEMPFLETLEVNTPISPYAATKKSAEMMAYTYHHLYDIDVSIVRYFTVYGPLSRPDMAQMRFMRWIDQEKEIQLYGDGKQSRDFTYVDDIALGTIAAMKDVGYEIINLGGGKNPTEVNEMISMLETHLGKKAKVKNLPMNKADMDITWANIDKAKKLLNWEPKVSFKDGIEKCINHYQDHKQFYQEISLEEN
jgi:nucleoside-diphosphate-sugar epimerase